MEPPLSPPQQARVALPFLLVTLLWSTTWLVIRDGLGVVPPSWSISYRFFLAAAAMFAFAAATRQPLRMGRDNQLFLALFGAVQVVLNFNFVYHAEGYITSGLVALTFALLIVPNSLFGWLFLGLAISRRFLAGSAVALLGIGLMFLHELRASAAGPRAVGLGIGFALLAVLAASVFNLMQASARAKAMPMASLLAWGMLWGALIDAAFAWITAGAPVFDPRPGYWFGVVYLGLFASAVAFLLYFNLIRAIGPARAAYSSVLVPDIAMTLSTLFAGYRWSPPAASGAALTLVGLLIALRARSPAR